MKITNPATGALLKEIPCDDEGSLAVKFKKAQRAQKAWALLPLSQRQKAIRNFRELLVSQKERLSQLLTSEVGKPITQARGELGGTLGRLDYFLDNVEQVLRPQEVFRDGKMVEQISQEPLGVIANISVWNYPYFVGTNVFIPALLTGNAVLYKPSEFAALTGLAIAELLHEAGVPPEVFVPIMGDGKVGAQLLELPVKGVFFTGSRATGAKIAQLASRRFIKMQLELGGKDPVYVSEDVDVAAVAASTADGAFYNTGQGCCSVERLYVHEKIYTQFVDEFLKTVRGLKSGDPTQDDVYIGPLTRAPQIEVLEKQVADAIEQGAKLLCGGKRQGSSGQYFEPTVLTHVHHRMEVMREESFGPIIGIQKVSGDSEAIALMNDTTYGLTAGVYTRNEDRARSILEAVNAGSAYWNCCDRVSPRLPWTGRGDSGIGSTLSVLGMQAFVQPKAWHLRSP